MNVSANSTLMKSLPIIATMLGKQHGINVICDPTIQTAMTNGRTIYLPPIPDNEDAKVLVSGYIDHESAHIRETDFDVPFGAGLTATLLNIIEDIRIEKILGGIYPGCRKNLLALEEWLVNNDGYDITDENSHPAVILVNRIHHGLRVKVLKNLCTQDLADKALAAFNKVFPQDLVAKIEPLISEAETAKDTEHARDISDAIVAIIKAADPEQYKDQAPPPPPPSKSENSSEDESSDSSGAGEGDGDAGHGGQGEIGDGNGEGEGDSNPVSPTKNESEEGESTEGGTGDGEGDSEESDGQNNQDGGAGNGGEPGDDSDDSAGGSSGDGEGDSGTDESTKGSESGSDSSSETGESETNSGNDGSGDADAGDGETGDVPGGSDADQGEAGNTDTSKSGQDSSGSAAESAVASPIDGPAQAEAIKALQQSLEEEVVKGSDLGDKIAALINSMSQDARKTGIPTVSIASTEAHDNSGREHLSPGHVLAQTNALRARLVSLVEASKRKRTPARRVGTRIQTQSLYKLSYGDSRIFQSKHHKPAVNTGIVILVDESSSMTRLAGVANESAMATALALEGIPGVNLAVAGFGSRLDFSTMTYIPRIAPRKAFSKRVDPTSFVGRAEGYTPMTQALQWAVSELSGLRNITRKIVFVITDGEPDCPVSASETVRKMEAASIETYGLGIKHVISKSLIPKSSSITDIQDLPAVVFNLLKNILIEE